jgi:hypothetical protein
VEWFRCFAPSGLPHFLSALILSTLGSSEARPRGPLAVRIGHRPDCAGVAVSLLLVFARRAKIWGIRVFIPGSFVRFPGHTGRAEEPRGERLGQHLGPHGR